MWAASSWPFVLKHQQLISGCSCIWCTTQMRTTLRQRPMIFLFQEIPENEQQLHPVLQLLQSNKNKGIIRVTRHSVLQLEEGAILGEEHLLSVLATRLVERLEAVLDPRRGIHVHRTGHYRHISPNHLCNIKSMICVFQWPIVILLGYKGLRSDQSVLNSARHAIAIAIANADSIKPGQWHRWAVRQNSSN